MFALFVPFLLRLSTRTRNIFLLAGATYVFGAVGMEIPEGIRSQLYGQDFVYALYAALEEGMEMAGVVLFLGELLAHYAARGGAIGIVVRTETKR
jgi:hypothetical protein